MDGGFFVRLTRKVFVAHDLFSCDCRYLMFATKLEKIGTRGTITCQEAQRWQLHRSPRLVRAASLGPSFAIKGRFSHRRWKARWKAK